MMDVTEATNRVVSSGVHTATARADVTLMPVDDFDALLVSLDVAENVPVLARLGKSEPFRRK